MFKLEKKSSIELNQFSDNIIDDGLSIEKLENQIHRVKSRYILPRSTSIDCLEHHITIENIDKINYLDEFGVLKPIKKQLNYTAFEYFQLELKTINNEFIYLYNHKPFTVEFNKKHTTLSIKIIHDAPFLHPTWDYSKGQRESTASPTYKKGTKFEASFILQKSEVSLTSFLPSFYPKQTKACFILTDHCDFDTAEKLDLFLHGNNKNDGWLNKSLKITKGVFRFAPLSNEERKSDDLENQVYKKLIDKLQNDGSEIAPHALKHSGQIDGNLFSRGLEYLASEYKCKTWIDHGHYIEYCYSQGGQNNPEYKTLDTLSNLNYTSLWSYHDVALDPTYSLDYFEPKKFSRLNGIWLIFKHLIKLNFLYSAHYIRSFVHKSQGKSLITDFLNYFFACSKIILSKRKINIKLLKEFITQLSKFRTFRSKIVLPFTLNELNKYLPPVFTSSYQTINNWSNELLFFNTIETTHNKDIYTRKQLDSLIRKRGLHIGHTYILNSLPYLNGIFKTENNKLKLSEEWIDFTNYLSEKVTENEIWNPNMSEFVERVKAVLNIEYYLMENGLKIINNNEENINELKFIQSDGDEIIFNIPANTEQIQNKQV